jgi:hypothetical protein
MTVSTGAGTHLQEVNFDVSYSVANGITKPNTAKKCAGGPFYISSRQSWVLVSYRNCQRPFATHL